MASRYTFRLKPDRDADLIAWLDGLGDGERSCFIRNALRRSLTETFDHSVTKLPQRKLPSEVQSFQTDNTDISDEPSSEEHVTSKLDQLTSSF